MTDNLTVLRCEKIHKMILDAGSCCICMEPFDLTKFNVITSCGHPYCSGCMDTYFDASTTDIKIPTCASCRGTITELFKMKFVDSQHYDMEKIDLNGKHEEVRKKKSK